MRINKTTIEYIKGLVKAKAQPKLDALNASLEKAKEKDSALRESYNAEIEKLQKKATADALRLASKFKIDVLHYMNWNNEKCEREAVADFSDFTGSVILTSVTAEIEKTKSLIGALKNEIEKKCTEIVARLSLGGTVADLDRLIAELKF